MKAPIIAFFNNKGGVGKTSLVYHLAHMFAYMDKRVLAADIDPQANLTSAFLDEESLESLWPDGEHANTIFGDIHPLLRGLGDIVDNPHLEEPSTNIYLLPGDLALSRFESELSVQWPACMDRNERAFRVTSAFWRTMQNCASKAKADLILMDLGPNLGAINRSALVASDYLVIPLAPDLFSLQGLRNLGPTIRDWRKEWEERLRKNPDPMLELPKGNIKPIGYVIMQHAVRLDRPVKSYDRWVERIPETYCKNILGQTWNAKRKDPTNQIGLVKHYRSLMPMAQEANKPIFYLKSADGAIGAHTKSVQNAFKDFKKLAIEIAKRSHINL